jgi:hypothetical protein
MNWLGSSAQTPPNCFGKSWDQHAPECAGGLDPAYRDEKGSHIRNPCRFFSECGSRCQASKMQQAQDLIPVTSLTRAWQRPSQPGPSAPAPIQQGVHQFAMQQLQQQLDDMRKRATAGQLPMVPMYPQSGFQQMMPVNYEMPQYLTQREYRRADESVFKVLGREVFRSVLKSAGHTFANFWDSTAIIPKPPPKE